MSFPRKGVEHHTDPEGNTAASRINRHGTDMSAVVKYLHEVAYKIKSEQLNFEEK